MEIGAKNTSLNKKFNIILGILSGIFFGSLMALMDYAIGGKLETVSKYVIMGGSYGIVMGIGFPFFSTKLVRLFSTKITPKIKPDLVSDEHILAHGPANLYRGIEGVGGKLFLTESKLIFKSHHINIQKGQTDICYAHIKSITPRKTMKIIDNGIRITTREHNTYNFVVNDRALWIKTIQECIENEHASR